MKLQKLINDSDLNNWLILSRGVSKKQIEWDYDIRRVYETRLKLDQIDI